MGSRISRTYLFPCTGFVSSIRNTSAPLGAILPGSQDVRLSPNEGQILGRQGSRLIGEASATSPVGALPIRVGVTSLAIASPTNIVSSGSTMYSGLTSTANAFANVHRGMASNTSGVGSSRIVVSRESNTYIAWDGSVSASGTVAFGWQGMFCRHLFPLKSPSPTDGEETFGAIFADQNDIRFMGTIYARSTNTHDTGTGAAVGYHYVLGQEYGTTHYPQTTGDQSATWRYKAMAMPYYTGITRAPGSLPTSGGMGLTRGASQFLRSFWCGGGRQAFQSDKWLHATSLYATPLKWNKAFNELAGTGTEINRIQPWGNIPPLWAPTYTLPSATVVDAEKNWKSGDTFYVSVLFEMEDGSYSMPVLPRAQSATWGSVGLVGPLTGTDVFYPYITYGNIPIGPEGTRARLLLRTEKINTGTTVVQDVPVGQLKTLARIADNTSTTYQDVNGNDNSLVDDPKIVRYDHIWAPRSRYVWEFDQRVGVGYTALNPCAIILAPVSNANATTYDMNGADTSSACYGGANINAYRLLKVSNGGAYTFQLVRATGFGGAPVVNPSSPSMSSTTLQDVVDDINQTVMDATGGSEDSMWKAVLAPGVDGNTASTNLAPTVVQIDCTVSVSGSVTTLTADASNDFTDVAVGMVMSKISGNATVPAGVYVTEKVSATVIKLSAAFTGTLTGSHRLHFYNDLGDGVIVSGGLVGYVRCYGAASPAVIPFRGAYLESLGQQPRDIYFTTGAPGTAATAANAFVVGNRRRVPESAGIFMGGAPLTTGAVLCYSKAIYVLQNRKGGTSGEDLDYRAYPLNLNRGCIAPDSIKHGDGWVGYMTTAGYIVTDGAVERLISLDIHDPATQRGSLSAAIQNADMAARADTDGSTIHAMVADSRLHLTYGSFYHPATRQVYDFSRGAEASGLNEVLKDIGGTESTAAAYGWSAPYSNNTWGCMAATNKRIKGATGISRMLVGASDSFNIANSTGDGRFYEFDLPESGGHLPDVTQISGCTASAGNVTAGTNFPTNGFKNIRVGMQVDTPISSEIALTDYVFVKSITDGNQLTISTKANGSHVSASGQQFRFQNPVKEACDERTATTTVTTNGTTTLSGAGTLGLAIGAIVSGTGIPADTWIVAKDPINQTATMSRAATNSPSVALTADKWVIQPTIALAADVVDSIRMLKSVQSATLLYRHFATAPQGILTLSHNSRLTSPLLTTVTIPTTSTAETGRLNMGMPLAARSPGEVCEFSLSHTGGYPPGNRPEIWGIEAEMEVLDAVPAY